MYSYDLSIGHIDCGNLILHIYFQEEKRTLERELARAKVSANRIANIVANEWKDESHKNLPPRQWQEEKRILKVCMNIYKFFRTILQVIMFVDKFK